MKVSLNWLGDYLGFELPPTNELTRRIGAQLGAVETVSDIGTKYQGTVVVKVVECAPLENSDHLNLCFIDDGGVTAAVERRQDGLVQVVCGAPNVAAGVTVAWLPPGSTVPSSYGSDPFVLEARPLRGAVSNGMLASPKELAVGDSHEGLLLLEDDIKPGTPFADVYKLDDKIIDIENKMFTHRPDCFGQLGIAREVAGILGRKFTSPQWYQDAPSIPDGQGLPLDVDNQLPGEVPRFMAAALGGIVIKPSPVWLQTYLSRIGVRPINNVVDVTNYMMLLTGQPLHAYDYDKVAALSDGEGVHLVVRYPRPGEQLELLSGKTIQPRDQAIMIATDRQAIGLGGVMGGGNTEVDENTKNVILECATFDMYSIRRTSMAHGLFTDAVTRFNKGQSRLQNPAVLAESVRLLGDLADAWVMSAVIDDVSDVSLPAAVTIDVLFINSRLGLRLSASQAAELLTNIEFTVTVQDQALVVQAPFWRTDIAEPEDIVEEVGRLYGFDKLPLELPRRAITPVAADRLMDLKTAVRDSLSKAGANELLTYSFVHGDMLAKAAQDPAKSYKLGNALSPDLQYYRQTALPSLLDKVHGNIKAGYDSFALFELSKGHDKSVPLHDGVPLEFEDLDFIYTNKYDQPGAAFYHARRYLETLGNDLKIELDFQPVDQTGDDPVTDPYDLKRAAAVLASDTYVGVVGELKPAVRRGFKLPDYCAAFTINVSRLLGASRQAAYRPLSRFPRLAQDITLKLPTTTAYADLLRLVNETLTVTKPEESEFTVRLNAIYQRPEDTEHRQLTFHIELVSYLKTLTDQEVSGLLDQVAAAAAQRFQAERI